MERIILNETEYHNIIRWGLMAGIQKESKHINESGTVITEQSDPEEYKFRLSLSKLIQENSSVVMIDPNISGTTELKEKFEEYKALSPKYKTISDFYSYQIWGSNVNDMYYNVVKEFAPKQHGVVVESESSSNRLFTFDRFYTTVSTSMDDLLIKKAKAFFEADRNMSSETRRLNQAGYNKLSDLPLPTPSMCPWFTITEMELMGVPFVDIEEGSSYFNEVIKAKVENNQSGIIRLGWNPSLNLNKETNEAAVKRQNAWFSNHGPLIFNLNDDVNAYEANYTVQNNPIEGLDDIYPVYILAKDELPTNIDDLFSFVGISFSAKLDNIFMLNAEGTLINSFNPVERGDIDPDYKVSIYAVFLNSALYNNLVSVVQSTIDPCNMSNVTIRLLAAANQFDPTVDRLVMFNYCYMIHKLSGGAMFGNNPSCYRLYNGLMKDYNSDRAEQIMGIFRDRNYADRYVTRTFLPILTSNKNETVLVNQIAEAFKNEVCIPNIISITKEEAMEIKRKMDELERKREEEKMLQKQQQRGSR